MIRDIFDSIKEQGKIALLSYMVAGYPNLEKSLEAFKYLIEGGSHMIEIGLPFSDPVADGETIQRAHAKALENKTSIKDVFYISKTLKSLYKNVPLILMTYYNPIFTVGIEKFVDMAKENGIDGFIVPDLPYEESFQLKEALEKNSLSFVPLVAPTSFRLGRHKKLCDIATDFSYLVSVRGITGERQTLPFEEVKTLLKMFKKDCEKPVVVGFGISKKEHILELKDYADGVVVGSHFINALDKGLNLKEEVQKLLV